MRELIIFLISVILSTWLNIIYFEELVNLFAYQPLLLLLIIFGGFCWIYFTLSNMVEIFWIKGIK